MDVIDLIKKVLNQIKSNPLAMDRFESYCNRRYLTAYRFVTAAGNHCFDDDPEFWSLTEQEATAIRGFCHQNQENLFTQLEQIGLKGRLSTDT